MSTPAAPTLVERYYIVQIAGQRAGHMLSTQRTEGNTISTQTSMTMKLARGDMRVEIMMGGMFEETLEGKPLRMRSEQRLGQMLVTNLSTFADGTITTITTQGEIERESETPDPGDWVPPARMEREVKKQFEALLANDALPRRIVVRTMDPLNGAAVLESVRTGFELEAIEIDGKEVNAYKVQTTISSMPGVQSTEWVDDAGEMLRSQTSVGGLQVTLVRSDKATALGENTLGERTRGNKLASKPAEVPEIMLSTFVKPDKVIANPRSLSRVTFVLRARKPGAQLADVPSTGQQCVERIDDSSVRVRVSTSALCEGDAPLPADVARFLASTTLADASDAKVIALHNRALDGKHFINELAKAQALREGVRDAIDEKTLGVGFATASEVVRTGEGDCTEHAVLLVAVLRAAGIPARAVTGLVYADQFAGEKHIFGYHMWAQALLEDETGTPRWVDLDAALPGAGFDATHIALGTTDLADADSMRSLVQVAGFLGELAIQVQEAE